MYKMTNLQMQSLKIKKKEFVPIKPKVFIKRVNLNLILSKIINSCFYKSSNRLIGFPDNKLKISLYKLLKLLKNSKRLKHSFGNLGWKFQLNGFYTSLVESKKKIKVNVLKDKIKTIKSDKAVIAFFQKPSFISGPAKKRKSFSNLSRGLGKFENLYNDYSVVCQERQAFFETLKARRFFPSIFFSRLFLYAAKGRKKYRNVFFYIFKRKRKIDSLFHVYTLSSLKFKDIRKQRRKLYKRITWKIRKQKKWRRRVRVSFALFRLRQKLSQVFYVPKHFEVNYKTFTTNYLGYTDVKTTNTKIPFWLNLRKLLTFVT